MFIIPLNPFYGLVLTLVPSTHGQMCHSKGLNLAAKECFQPSVLPPPAVLFFAHIKSRLLHSATNGQHLPPTQSHEADGWTYVQLQLSANVAVSTQQHDTSLGHFLEEFIFINKTLAA